MGGGWGGGRGLDGWREVAWVGGARGRGDA